MADMNDLKHEWDAQPEYMEESMNEIVELVRTRSGSMRSILFKRDIGEAIAALFVIVFFGCSWFWVPNLIEGAELGIRVSRTGIAITIVGAIAIIVITQWVQRRGRIDFAAVPLREFLQAEVQLLNGQIALLKHVAWWYLLPAYLGTSLLVIGLALDGSWESGWAFVIPYCLCSLGMFVYIWWLNQQARRNTLEPLRNALLQTYEGLLAMESESPQTTSPDREADLVELLRSTTLKTNCHPSLRFIRPGWPQVLVILLAGLSGFLAGMQIQDALESPRRYEEWPLLGLMVTGSLVAAGFCVRRKREDESIE